MTPPVVKVGGKRLQGCVTDHSVCFKALEEDVVNANVVNVSNVVPRSRRTRMLGEPEAAAISRSLVTFNRAVSLLWLEAFKGFK